MPGGAGSYTITHGWTGLKFAVVAGGAAGAHTVTGIRLGSQGKQSGNKGDQLIAVLNHTDAAAIVDLTSEFTITADDTIDNTGGTATTSDQLIVVYNSMTAYDHES